MVTDELTYKTERCTDLENELMVDEGEGVVREFEKGMYSLLYSKRITNKDLLYSTWNSAQCYMAAWMGGEFRGKWIHVYVWLNPFAIHLKLITTLLISYTAI